MARKQVNWRAFGYLIGAGLAGRADRQRFLLQGVKSD